MDHGCGVVELGPSIGPAVVIPSGIKQSTQGSHGNQGWSRGVEYIRVGALLAHAGVQTGETPGEFQEIHEDTYPG